MKLQQQVEVVPVQKRVSVRLLVFVLFSSQVLLEEEVVFGWVSSAEYLKAQSKLYSQTYVRIIRNVYNLCLLCIIFGTRVVALVD